MGVSAAAAALAEEGGDLGLGGGGVGGSGEGAEDCLNYMPYNNSYVDGGWGLFRHAGVMRLITCKAILAGIKLPMSPI